MIQRVIGLFGALVGVMVAKRLVLFSLKTATGDTTPLADTAAWLAWAGPGLNGGLTLLQHAAYFAFAIFLARRLGGDALALKPGVKAYLIPGVLGAITVGVLSGWIVTVLRRLLESYDSPAASVGGQVRDTGASGWIFIVVAIAFTGPIVEELLFRGYLWKVIEAERGQVVAFVGTSLLFMLHHWDPTVSIGLLPTALFLGWLRWMSGSIWPSMAGHLINNWLSLTIAIRAAGEPAGPPAEIPLYLALNAFALTCSVCLATWAILRFRAEER